MFNKIKLLDKSEAMTLLTTKAASHWSFIKFCFNIPLVITSSAMCIINSISEDARTVKIPNIVVNAISVLIISLNNSIKAGEKFELFKKLSQQFMQLSQEIENIEEEITKEKADILTLKYDNLINDTNFEDIPEKFKLLVASKYSEADRFVPIQINGTIGNITKKINGLNYEIKNNIV
jgi:cell division protein FtsB